MYAVIFTSDLSEDSADYEAAAAEMAARSRSQPGFISIDSVRDADGHGITVCMWESLDAIAAWKADAQHLDAQATGRQRWYDSHDVTVCEVLDAR